LLNIRGIIDDLRGSTLNLNDNFFTNEVTGGVGFGIGPGDAMAV